MAEHDKYTAKASQWALGFCDRASWAYCEVREKTNKMQQLDVYYQHFLNMFHASLCHLQEKKTCVTARGVLRCNKRGKGRY